MVIVEGPDNSGKSTLVSMLEKELDIKATHSGGPANTEAEIIERMDRIQTKVFDKVLFDRVPCISDQVYAHVLRGGSPFEKTKHLKRLIMHEPLIIYCRPPTHILIKLDDHVVKAHETVEHVEAVKANRHKLIKRYDDLMKDIPHIFFDWTATSSYSFNLLLKCIELHWRNY